MAKVTTLSFSVES